MMRAISLCAVVLYSLSPLWAAETADRATAKQAIIEASRAYAAAFNKHDAKALAALWSKDGVHVDRESGRRTVGRAAIERLFADMFQQREVRRLAVTLDSIRLVTPEVAAVEGSATVTLQDGEPSDSTFSAVFVKQEGKWLLDSAHETNLPPPPKPYDHLQELQWLVGTWADESKETKVTTVCQWTANRSFLRRSFTVSVGDEVLHQATQIIGWDPHRQCMRTWIFGSEGGFAEGVCSREGDRWTVKLHGVLPDGRKGSATQVITKLNDNTMTSQLISVEVGGELMPSRESVKVVRLSDSK